jgi:hypothetical protein
MSELKSRVKPIKHTYEKHSLSWLKEQNDEGLLNFNPKMQFQRNYVWVPQLQNELLGAALLGVSIGDMTVEEREIKIYALKEHVEGVPQFKINNMIHSNPELVEEVGEDICFDVYDGKQRGLTFIAFLNDEFAISDKIDDDLKIVDGVELVGKKYSDLPTRIQRKFSNIEISICRYRPLSDEQRRIIFKCKNNGKAVNPFDKARIYMGDENMERIINLTNHSFMADKANLTKSNIRDRADEKALISTLLLIEDSTKNIGKKDVDDYCREVGANGFKSDSMEKLVKGLNYMDQAFDDKTKELKVKLIHIAYLVAQKAMKANLEPQKFGELFVEFMQTIAKDKKGEYFLNSQSGTDKSKSISLRVDFISKFIIGDVQTTAEGMVS